MHHVLLADSGDSVDDLIRSESDTTGDELPADVLGDSGAAVQGEQEGATELGLGALQLAVGKAAGADSLPLVDDAPEEPFGVLAVPLQDCVDAPEADVRVGGGKGHEGVAERLGNVPDHALAERRQAVQTDVVGPVEVADNGLRNQRREVVRRRPRAALDRQRHVQVGQRVVLDVDVARLENGQPCSRGAQWLRLVADRHVAKVLERNPDHLLVVHAAGTDEHHPVALVVGPDVVFQVFLLDGLDAFDGAKNRSAERLVLEDNLVQPVKHNLVVHLVHFLTLSDDHGSFLLDGHLFQLRSRQNIAQDVHTPRDVLLERLGVVDRVFPGGVCIQVRSAILHLQLQVHLRPVFGAFERQMLEKMGRARRLVRHVGSRACVNPHANRGRQCVWDLLGGNSDAVWQHCHFRI